MKSGLLLAVVARECAAVLQLLPSEDETLLVWRDALLVLNFLFHIVDRVSGLYFQSDGLSG